MSRRIILIIVLVLLALCVAGYFLASFFAGGESGVTGEDAQVSPKITEETEVGSKGHDGSETVEAGGEASSPFAGFEQLEVGTTSNTLFDGPDDTLTPPEDTSGGSDGQDGGTGGTSGGSTGDGGSPGSGSGQDTDTPPGPPDTSTIPPPPPPPPMGM